MRPADEFFLMTFNSGTRLVPDLQHGRYGAYLKQALSDYTGRATRHPIVVDLLDREKLPLVAYTPPRLSTQAINFQEFGDVRLRLAVDRASGHVTGVTPLAGPYFPQEASTAAAWEWRFAPDLVSADGVDVTVRFQLRCE